MLTHPGNGDIVWVMWVTRVIEVTKITQNTIIMLSLCSSVSLVIKIVLVIFPIKKSSLALDTLIQTPSVLRLFRIIRALKVIISGSEGSLALEGA